MTYRSIVKFINWLIKIANAIRLLQCKKSGECICMFCSNDKCRNRHVSIDNLIDPEIPSIHIPKEENEDEESSK